MSATAVKKTVKKITRLNIKKITDEVRAEIVKAAFDAANEEQSSLDFNLSEQTHWHRVNYEFQHKVVEEIDRRYPDLYPVSRRRLWDTLILQAFSLSPSGLHRHHS